MNPASKTLKSLMDFLIISVVAVAGAAVVHYFMLPFNLTIGSIPGLAMVVSHIIPLSVSAITMICNGCLLAAGIILVGKEFGLKTIYSVILFTGSLAVLEAVSPAPASIMEDAFLDMLCYIFLMSACQAILFDRGASLGGLDIVAKILNKLMHMDVGKAVSNAGLCVAVSSVLVFDLKVAILSVLGTYLNGIVVDHFIFGINPKKRVCIISKKEPEILDYILNTLQSGASLVETIGAYTGNSFREIITIVDKQEFRILMSYLEKVDPDAFITIYTVHEVHYRPKPLRQRIKPKK
ncbi:MAG: YitT family protein [Oscillospiraceae bacterium]|nr:YitT family protein [Oscillospiraceae bacterium]